MRGRLNQINAHKVRHIRTAHWAAIQHKVIGCPPCGLMVLFQAPMTRATNDPVAAWEADDELICLTQTYDTGPGKIRHICIMLV